MPALPALLGLSATAARLVLIELEGLLGLWLLMGLAPRLAWSVTVGAFAVFAGESLYLVSLGQASCGCFGSLRVHPWYSFGLDAGVLLALAIVRPRWAGHAAPGRLVAGLARGFAGVAALSVALLGVSSFWFSSPADALAYLRGDRLTVEPSAVDFGRGKNAEQKTATVMVRNRTDQPVRIVGGTSDCSCVATEDLPVTVGPNERATVTIRFGYPRDSTGLFARMAWLMTDDPHQPILALRLSGLVVADETQLDKRP